MPDMKSLCATLLAGLMLVSCNTTIGVGRDLREGYQWSKRKIQESRSGGSQDDYGAPVY